MIDYQINELVVRTVYFVLCLTTPNNILHKVILEAYGFKYVELFFKESLKHLPKTIKLTGNTQNI